MILPVWPRPVAMKKTFIQAEYGKLPRFDLVGESGSRQRVFTSIRRRFLHRWLRGIGKRFWADQILLDDDYFFARVRDAICKRESISIGRLGGVEAAILMWADCLSSLAFFDDTLAGATNAGIRPRNRDSYLAFGRLCREALDGLDLQGVWKTGYEALCIGTNSRREFFTGEVTVPDGNNPQHWICGLGGRKILLVSPFQTSIERQIPQLSKIWPRSEWMKGVEFIIEPFPYLIDENCQESWWDVYARIGTTISRGDYDIALFGCGGLGLPFAHLAKEAGKVGIHLGGHLQILFGIFGERHIGQPWIRDQMNDYWIRPCPDEVPHSAVRVEDGCYW